ncbi:asparagine synthase (glutamine-hydrolyzing) [Aquibacillus halophilus]|uniref:asparagine synthase (glutamine-hydrolyzing) n=1 Tax=Aquibacillus halophilus TaxID=930132 RepID=A0A6A8DEX0_9BACI|nr:asparagine synthase (glutamine-hydrolyzing) [Aquibacillus halophilus]MRH44193.1 asparagine synthase (glutamine-hydrolyzing) [Aquibacillus halophilus]
MCGITGWIDFNRELSTEVVNVRKMANAIQHRGPDEHNEWISDHVAFGHQRLIVVDPDGGKQPMECIKDKSNYILVYNGELYNTEDIRSELLNKGWGFDSHSDTEVLLKSYIQWGEECVKRFNGIFAFAIWDSKKEQLFIARDRLGVKPLFYMEKDGGLLFASELKALIAHEEVEPILDREGLSEILALGPSRTPGHGVFKGMNELRAAHIGMFDKNGFRTERYWNVQSTPHTDDVEETADVIRYLLTDAVERQLVSDVPLGTFLSGGVDSSAITAIASNYLKRHKKGKLNTFSIDFEDNQKYFKKSSFQPNNDQDFIGTVVDAHETNHHNFVINNKKLAEMLKEAVEFRDLPGMADVDSSLLWFCRQTKQEVTVALSGECADEIFGGYPWFYREDDLEREGFPWIRSSEVRSSLLTDEWQEKLNLNSYMLKRYQETIDETPDFEGDSEIEKQRRQMFYLNMHWFMPTLLDRKDRMSMGASFEARVPFSDHRLVEYVWNIPWEMKTYRGREKGILRKALEGLLPDEILYRKKSPYPKTHNPVYKDAVVAWLNEILEDPNARLFEIFDKNAIRKLVETEGKEIEAPWFGQLMTGPQLLAHLGQIDHWLRTYNIKIER